jgi:hypothetical protein
MDKKPGLLAQVPKEDVADDLRKPLAASSQRLRICTQLQYEAVLPVHLPLTDAPRASKHACRGQWIQTLAEEQRPTRFQSVVGALIKTARRTSHACIAVNLHYYLKSTAERADRTLGSMRAKPRRVAPHELAVAAGMHLAPTDGQLDVPHLRGHLPQHEAARLRPLRRHAVPHHAAARLELSGHHPHLAHRVGVPDRGELLLPARGSQVLLQNVLRRRRLLRRATSQGLYSGTEEVRFTANRSVNL